MNHSEISVRRLPGRPQGGGIQGIVTIQTGRNRSHILHCKVAHTSLRGARAALVSEALRQLARMPEYRRLDAAG